jgi:hypothetical protein
LVWHVVVAAAVAGLATFVVARAVRVPLTYDEAAAYLRYIAADPLAPFDFSVATNHLLNSLLTKLFSTIAGSSEVVLRMPSLIGYGLYVGFSLLMLRQVRHREIALGAFLLLHLNPYVLDYFALSRGYGLSLGLMAGAIFFLLEHRLGWSLAFACVGVMANFALLNVYLALVLIGLVVEARVSRASSGIAASRASGGRTYSTPRGYYVWGPAIVVVYTLLVFSQDFGLSEELYQPVTVRLVSLNGAALDTARVFRIDRRGRMEPLRRQGDLWSLDRRDHFCAVRIELPLAAADDLASIEVVAGNRSFRAGKSNESWRRSDAGGARTLDSTETLSLARSKIPAFRGVINWSGDRRYAFHLAVRTAFVLSILIVLAIVLTALGVVATRAGVLSAGAWAPVATSALWIAALAGGPLYLLRRNGELYYGGESGLVQDTFRSVIDGSFYGRSYHPDQVQIVLAVMVATVAVFGVSCGLSYRRGTSHRILPAALLLAIIAIVSMVVVAQRLLFGTPYLLGRTALFFIPVFLLFAAFTVDTIAVLGRVGRVAGTTVLFAAVALSVYHFGQTANVTYTLDWPRDAATKTMVADVVALASPTAAPDSPVLLGVEWPFYPVAEFYSRRAATPIDVHVLPRRGGTDLMYLADTHGEGSVEVIRRYPLARSMLARAKR